MKKKTVLIIASVMAAIILALYIAVCCIYSLWTNENKAFIAGLVIFPLLPFILLLATLPSPSVKLKNADDNNSSNSKETDGDNKF